MTTSAPIAFFAFNRPEHTQQALESLAANTLAQRSELFIFCDGPRRPEDQPAVTAVRKIACSADWCKSVHVISRDTNLGCAESVIAGVTRLCAEHDRVIVLEDDLILSPFFLEYMNDALSRYADDPRVMQISGYMFPTAGQTNADACFLPFTSSWGWATWSRAWKNLDKDMLGYQKLAEDPALRKQFDLNGAFPYFDMLTAQRLGKIDSWAIRWYLGTFLAGGLTLFPRFSLVENIGFDGSGRHYQASSRKEQTDKSFRVARLPDDIVPDRSSAAEIESFLADASGSRPSGLLGRVRKWFL